MHGEYENAREQLIDLIDGDNLYATDQDIQAHLFDLLVDIMNAEGSRLPELQLVAAAAFEAIMAGRQYLLDEERELLLTALRRWLRIPYVAKRMRVRLLRDAQGVQHGIDSACQTWIS